MPSAGPDDDATWQRAVDQVGTFPRARRCSERTAAEALLAARFRDDDIRVFAPRAARFRCDCSQRARRATRCGCSGRTEIESILAEQGMVGVTCEFCNRRYRFVADDARALFAQPDADDDGPPDAVRH